MTRQDPVFYGHWRHMLSLAREQASAKHLREADRLAGHAASIILSRTCLEIFFNELYFLQVHEGILSDQSTHYSHRRKKRLTLSYRNFVDMHICERLEVSHPSAPQRLIEDVSLQNQIRNYCIHYTASDVKKRLELDFSRHPKFSASAALEDVSPQEIYVNEDTSIWCNDVTLNTVIAVEEAQDRAHSNSELNIEHCKDILN